MSKFASRPPARPTAPVQTLDRNTFTHEGALAHSRDAKSDLFLLAVTNMVGEETFYEKGEVRDRRFIDLVHQVTAEDPEWVARFAPYLRGTMNMRSASIVLAAEYVNAGGPNGRRVVDAVIQRADEPAEMYAYWQSIRPGIMPKPIKRGVADAIRRLYNQRSVLKWDGNQNTIRFADLIELSRAEPTDERQSALFRHLTGARQFKHESPDPIPEILDWLRKDHELQRIPMEQRRARLGEAVEIGWAWERLSGWLPGGMDAEAWESIIPNMGYMALLRNLRNFDQAKVSYEVAQFVAARLTDPEQVAQSRQFPYRFWSAYKFAPSAQWLAPLERALDLAVSNIPDLPGRTLVLIDTSGSMQGTVSNKSKVARFEIGALFAAALAKRCARADVVIYGTDSARLPVADTQSVLRYIEQVGAKIGSVGHATYQWTAVERWWDGHDRIAIFTDDQAHDRPMVSAEAAKTIYTFNLAGYGPSSGPAGKAGRYTFGGFTDAIFQAIPLLERGRNAGWPF